VLKSCLPLKKHEENKENGKWVSDPKTKEETKKKIL
jgi:hypothetical protein